MKKPLPKDILLLIIITVISILCINFISLAQYPIIIISYFILAMFLPGYALLGAIYPRKEGIGFNRVVLSISISLVITFILIFTNNSNILNISKSQIFILIGIITILLSFIAIYRHYKQFKTLKNEEIRSEDKNRSLVSPEDIIKISKKGNKEDLKSVQGKGIVDQNDNKEEFLDKTLTKSTPESGKKTVKPYIKDFKPANENSKTAKNLNKKNSKFKPWDLVIILIVTLTSLFIILNPNLAGKSISTILMIPLILFLPGYALIAVLYPKKNDLDIYERLALSFGFPLMGLAIVIALTNILSIKINLNNILEILAILTIVMIFIALIRRKRAADDETFVYSRVKNIKNTVKPELYIDPKKDNIKNQGINSKDIAYKEITKSEDGSKPNLKQDNRFPSFVSKDLLIIFIATVLAVIFIVTPKLNDTSIRTILGILLILFIPGYSLIATLFPKKDDLDGIERAALSFGLSIAVTPLIGLALNYTPLGIRLTPILISLSAFTLVMLLVALIRRRRVSEGEKFFINFGGFFSSIKQSFSGESKSSKVLSVILILTIILAIATTVYIIVKPKQGESFTEFYLLGPNGKASDYPTNLTVGQNGTVIIGVVNHEHQTVNYQLVVTTNGTVMSQQNITLTNGNQTQIPYSFTAGSAGTKEIEFLLYKLPDTTNVYRSLRLFVKMN